MLWLDSTKFVKIRKKKVLKEVFFHYSRKKKYDLRMGKMNRSVSSELNSNQNQLNSICLTPKTLKELF